MDPIFLIHPMGLTEVTLRTIPLDIRELGGTAPSGNPEPSAGDLEVTKRFVQAGKLIGIEGVDHIIIGKKRASLSEEGLL